MDLVATWLVFDLPRTIAGALAGIFAVLVSWVFAGILAKAGGQELAELFRREVAEPLHLTGVEYGPVKGNVFVSARYKMTESAQMSARMSTTREAVTCSGDM